MKLTSRAARGIAAAAVACAAVMAPAIALATTGSPASSASPAFPMCQTPGLVIWLNTNGNGAAGSVFYTMNFTNLSGHTCTLNGFPFLFAVNLSGQQVGRRAVFSKTATPHTVTIANGKTAVATLQIVDALNFSHALCGKVTTAAGLKVFPPNQTRAKTIPFPFQACTSMRARVLSITPVK